MPVVILFATAVFVVLACGDDDDCDARETCLNKTDRIFTGRIIPVCDAETNRDGTTYSWKTDQGTCTCTLDSRANGNFWRSCRFE